MNEVELSDRNFAILPLTLAGEENDETEYYGKILSNFRLLLQGISAAHK